MKERPRPGRRGRLSEIFVASGFWIAWIGVVASPLAVFPWAVAAFALPKRIVAETSALLSSAFLAAGRVPSGWRDALGALWSSRAFRAAAPLVVVAIASSWWTASPVLTERAVTSLLAAATALVGWSLALPPARLERLLEALRWPAIVLSVIAIAQYHDVFQPFEFRSGADTERLRITSLAGNPSDLGAFLVLPCLLAQRGIAGSVGVRRWIWGATLATGVYALGATGTVTPVVALGVGSVTLWTVDASRRRRLVVAGVAAAIVVVGLVGTPVGSRISEKTAELAGGRVDQALSGRLDGWRVAWRIALDRPAGIGHGAFRSGFSETKLAMQEEGATFYPGHRYAMFGNAHNEILEVAAELGWVGVIALAWGAWCLFAGLRRSPPDPLDRGLRWGAVLAFVVLAVAWFPFRLALTGYQAVLLLALVFSDSRDRG